jgi:hypothetical protein
MLIVWPSASQVGQNRQFSSRQPTVTKSAIEQSAIEQSAISNQQSNNQQSAIDIQQFLSVQLPGPRA